MAENKIIFTGPVGVGKTTAIAALSDDPPIKTDARASDMTTSMKSHTTVAMDYGRMNLPNGDQVRLFGTPGQKRFDFMWDILTENALGLVLMLNAASPDPEDDLRSYVNAFRSFIDSTALVVGLTHVENGSWDTRQRLARELDQMGLSASVMDTDARSRAHMSALVKALIYGIDPFTGVES